MLHSPPGKIFCSLTTKYDDELKFDSGVKLYIDPSFNPNFHATSEGIVEAVPRGYEALRIGDTVLFGYKVVGDVTHENDPMAFYQVTKEEGYYMEWQNSEKWKLTMQVGWENKQWVGLLLDGKGEWLDGKRGSFGEVEEWVSKNKFTVSQGFTFDNLIDIDGRELWRVDLQFLFAVKRRGKWSMMNDYVLIEPIVEKKPTFIMPGVMGADSDQYVLREDKGWVRGIRGVSGVSHGDVVYLQADMKEKYNVSGKPMFIVRSMYLLAVEDRKSNLVVV